MLSSHFEIPIGGKCCLDPRGRSSLGGVCPVSRKTKAACLMNANGRWYCRCTSSWGPQTWHIEKRALLISVKRAIAVTLPTGFLFLTNDLVNYTFSPRASTPRATHQSLFRAEAIRNDRFGSQHQEGGRGCWQAFASHAYRICGIHAQHGAH